MEWVDFYLLINCKNMMDLQNFDLVLFHSTSGILSRAIELFTHSPWDHVGLILKDPTWLQPSLKGTYIWESTYTPVQDAESETPTVGVHITPLSDRIKSFKGKIYVRKANLSHPINQTSLAKTHDNIHHKSYDTHVGDWLCALLQLKPKVDRDDCFWCSAMVGYILVRMKFLNSHSTNWTTMRPSEFAPGGKIDGSLLPGLTYSKDLVRI